ncbi:MAG: hypothetical protein ACR2GR_07360 [Rhodothermales bacterium]
MDASVFGTLIGGLRSLLFSGIQHVLVGALLGFGIALVLWVACGWSARLWNQGYRLRLRHHLLRGVAALFTFLAVLGWSVTSYVDGLTETTEQRCGDLLDEGDAWLQQTFAEAYAAVQALETENFSVVPNPSTPGSSIPLTSPAAVQAVADVYAQSTLAYVGEEMPLLVPLVERGLEAVTGKLAAALQGGLGKAGVAYTREQAKVFVAENVVGGVLAPVRGWVWGVRLKLAAMLLVVQGIAFGLVGLSAYRDIHVQV